MHCSPSVAVTARTHINLLTYLITYLHCDGDSGPRLGGVVGFDFAMLLGHDSISPPTGQFLARDVIHTSLAYGTMSVSVCLSVRLSVTEVHWRIIANLGFKFRYQFTAHCGRGACGREERDHRREE